jgi:thiosulfate dehydrogenase (quinone) large subunit
MNTPGQKITEWFLRIALSAGFLSAVADRFGLWDKKVAAWGNWDSYITYTHTLIPFLSDSMVQFAGIAGTFLEVLFGIGLLTNYKTPLFAKGSGVLLLLFALAMTFSNSIKGPLDYSVFTASAAAFSLSVISSQKR